MKLLSLFMCPSMYPVNHQWVKLINEHLFFKELIMIFIFCYCYLWY